MIIDDLDAKDSRDRRWIEYAILAFEFLIIIT